MGTAVFVSLAVEPAGVMGMAIKKSVVERLAQSWHWEPFVDASPVVLVSVEGSATQVSLPYKLLWYIFHHLLWKSFSFSYQS